MSLLIQDCAEVDRHDNKRRRRHVLDNSDEVWFGDESLDFTPTDRLGRELCVNKKQSWMKN